MKHDFTEIIMNRLEEYFPGESEDVFNSSELIRYINQKTRSASSGSKSRGSFGNLYAIYVLVEHYRDMSLSPEDYINSGGANYSNLLERTRRLPFGSKIQNHSLNSRMNDEYKKYFPESEIVPIVRDVAKQKYWINPKAIFINIGRVVDISSVVIDIIERYIETKQSSLSRFISQCEILLTGEESDIDAISFIDSLLEPNVDARIFEIVAFAILKEKYSDEKVWFGFTRESIEEHALKLYKTGRTNANDGGIDYVMKPLGRFFQVTETLDVKKYFLDIDKIERFPISFVIKTNLDKKTVLEIFRRDAKKIYSVDYVVESYMASIEDIINISDLTQFFRLLVAEARQGNVLSEILKQARMEFHYQESDPATDIS